MHCRLHCILHRLLLEFALVEFRMVGIIALAVHAIAYWLSRNLQPRSSTTVDSAQIKHPKFVALHLEFAATVLHCSVRARRTAMQLRTMIAKWQLQCHRRSTCVTETTLASNRSATNGSTARLPLVFSSVWCMRCVRCFAASLLGTFCLAIFVARGHWAILSCAGLAAGGFAG